MACEDGGDTFRGQLQTQALEPTTQAWGPLCSLRKVTDPLCTSASAPMKGAAGASRAPDTRSHVSGIWHVPGSEKVPVSLGHKAPHPLGCHHHSRTYADPAPHAACLVRALGRARHGSQGSIISGGAAGGAGLATRSAGEPARTELGKLAPGRKPQSRGWCSPLKGPLLPGPLRPQPQGPPLTSKMTTARPHSSLSGTCALVTLPSAARPVPAPPRHLRDSGPPGLQGRLASRMAGFPSGRTSLSTSLKTVKGRRG